MRELAIASAALLVGMGIASVWALCLLAEFIEDNDALRSAIEEWAEADAAIPETARHDEEIPFAAFRRHAAAELALRALAEDAE